MNKKKTLLSVLLLLSTALCVFYQELHTKRRKQIIDNYSYKPTRLVAQNEESDVLEEEDDELEKEEELEEEEDEELEERDEEKEEDEFDKPEEPTEPEKEKPVSKEKDIFLNFDNADLKTFVDYIGDLKKINVVTDPKIAGNKISLTIRDPLSIEGAWNIFSTILEMSGFSIVKVGDLHKVIQKNAKLTEPLPVFVDTPAESLPDNDLTIRYVTFLTNIPISQARSLLQSMLSNPSKIIDHPNANGFVITDKSHNIKAAMKVIQELDRTDVKQSVTVMHLKQANADDVKKLFQSLMQKPQGHPLARLLGRTPDASVEYFPPTTKIIAEPRTNSLILLGDQKSIKRIEDFVVKYVDTELKGIKSPIHLYELNHTDVDQIKDILEAVTESSSDSPAAKYGGTRGGVKYFKKMRFAMDKANNRLLVSSTDDQDWRLLKKTIKSLDKPQPQVALETLIVSVNFDNTKQLGAQIRNKKHGQLGSNINAQAANMTNVIFDKQTVNGKDQYSLLGDLLQKMTFGLGSTVLSFGGTGDVWALVRMLKTQTNTSVLYKPFIVAKNMRKALISVGEKRRISYQQAVAEATGNIGDARGYQDAEAEIKIAVKPQINLDGIITLEIGVDLSEFQNTADVDRPDTSTRKLDTKVSIANGQVLVLGGFVKTKVIEDTYRTPLLGSIPILGWLFKEKKRIINKEYIFIFMAPTIIKPRKAPGVNLYTKMKMNQAKEDIDDAIEVRKTKDPIFNWFFNGEGETYSHKIIDYANARYQPTSVDIKNDPYYHTIPTRKEVAPLEPPEPPITPILPVEPVEPTEPIITPEPPEAQEPPIIEPETIETPEENLEEPDKDELEEDTDEKEEPEELEEELVEKESLVSPKFTIRRQQLKNMLSPGKASSRIKRRNQLKNLLSSHNPTENTLSKRKRRRKKLKTLLAKRQQKGLPL
ncbi:hypothetical protein KKA53_02545 [Candidatus Dependentiae bacterium]|nr:hypothetical protein [Candidatus Dependentiae bacterium]